MKKSIKDAGSDGQTRKAALGWSHSFFLLSLCRCDSGFSFNSRGEVLVETMMTESVASELGISMIDQRTRTRTSNKSLAEETVEKHNCRFSTVSIALLLLTNQQLTKATDDRLHKILDATWR